MLLQRLHSVPLPNTVNTKNTTKMRVYIDGKLNRYIYDVKDGATTFQMSFSTLGSNGGVRTVAFQPYNGNTPGTMSDTKTITISVANKPQVELLKISNPNATLGENITFTLRIKNATKVGRCGLKQRGPAAYSGTDLPLLQ